MALLEEVLVEGGATWADLARIGVGVGPGNFTGIRIGVSAARGLGLALEIPTIGVTSFEIISSVTEAAHIPVVPAPRDHVYVVCPGGAQAILPLSEAQALGAPLRYLPEPDQMACQIARIAAQAVPGAPPAPLYLKTADAAPARDTPPVILDEHG